ncbi:MAG: ABC transporter permease [Cyanobacteria bacterium]|nr:ABC transporter permease [Cyanobacteriota bacterium]
MSLYRRVLRLLSPDLERDYGAAMEDMFDSKRDDARRKGVLGLVIFTWREFGGLMAVSASHIISTIGQDTRQAARRLMRSPSFTIASVLTLALAIGANGAIYAVVKHVVIDPLPYADSDGLIELDHGAQRLKVTNGLGLTRGIYFHYLNRAQSIQSAAVYQSADRTLTGRGDPEPIRVTATTPSLAQVLGVAPVVGRWFTDEEGRPGGPAVVVLSHGFWTRKFGRDTNAIGQSIVIGDVPRQIIGVMPASFAFPDPRVELWTPEQIAPEMGFGLWSYAGVARLRDKVSYESARSELTTLLGGLAQAFPGDRGAIGNSDIGLSFTGRLLKEASVGNVRQALWMLLASVATVLLIACANIANLFLVRSDVRQREVAVRRALGAGRLELGQYFLSESFLLSAFGGGLGLGLAVAATRMLVTAGPSTLPRLREIQVDSPVIAYIALLSAIAAVAFGTIAFARSSFSYAALSDTGRANTVTRDRHRMRHVLLGGQVALALVLLIAAGLMARTFQNVRAIDPGFDVASALTFRIGLPARQFATRDAALAAHSQLLDRFKELPGVSGAAVTSCLPLSGGCHGNSLLIEGQPRVPGATLPIAVFRAVSDRYFETIGTRVLLGRGIDSNDVDHREPVAVVNDVFAKKFLGDRNPIGQRVASNRPPPSAGTMEPEWLTIVGVVANTPTRSVDESPIPTLYMPLSMGDGPDSPPGRIGPAISVLTYVLRTSTPPLDLVPQVRQAVLAFDGNLPIAQVASLQEVLDRASAQMQFTMVLLVIAASVSLLLGTIGIYGVMSYTVSRRTAEIGVRIALGAEPSGIAAQILKQGAVVTGIGMAIGLAAAFAGARFITSLLYGISARDPFIYVTTCGAVFGIALLACWLPARRAARLNPVSALRAE